MDVVTRSAKGVVQVVQTPIAATLDWTGDFIGGIRSAPSLKRDNARLQADAARLYALESLLKEEREKNARLQSLLKMPVQKDRKNVVARVIGLDFQNQRVLLNVGSQSGVAPGDPVLVPQGLVGQVVEVSPRSAYVNLLTHPNSSVGASVGGGSTAALGIVRGNGTATLLLEVFVEEAEVKANDLLLTSGVSAIYPAGLRIGIVSSVWLDRDFGVRKAIVQPFFQATALREVVVLAK
jgi:rod shape-determining protein MreC